MKKSIFRFRQDLRIYDNIWLYELSKENNKMLAIFILDENIINWFWWLSDPRFSFLKDALKNLNKDLKKIWLNLTIIKWKPEIIIPQTIKELDIDSIYLNKSYDTYWMQRDFEIKTFCKKNNIWFHDFIDSLLQDLLNIKPYKIFSPYFKTWVSNLPQKFELKKIKKLDTLEIKEIEILKNNMNIIENIDNIIKWKNLHRPINKRKIIIKKFNFESYEDTKNFPSIEWTSRLSPYIRFWIISIRHLYNIAKINNANNYIFELWRREFWHQISIYFPYTREKEFIKHRQDLKRENNEKLFEKFCAAKTGYPIIDASIKQLKETNRMHNRLRMVVASFLTKDLLIDRRRGEEFFKKYLLDYEQIINIWNWQRSASVWADPKPIRIFSPIRQAERFDSETKFIKKRIPELEQYSPKQIHDPLNNKLNYYQPIVNHKEQVIKAKEMYYWK
jgi:deoxyribodipyrimidine photo-lyase